MKLSIIIVNYNVKYFLEQCLCSVKKAIANMDAEVFVVDNNSSDKSIDYLKPKFPFVQFIANATNVGFAKANNQVLPLTNGEFVLFLNPDTIVPEDCFEKCISFFQENKNAGALGIKMIDGSGNFLKESKRGFPSPMVSFYKLSGLTSLFPHSKIFSKYYLGNLSENENQVIDAIAGAFFFTRKDVLAKTGGFDEQFFMYAEDIDLSYRIQQAGFENHYFSETTIIHFKGESTKKDFRYVKLFYKAMSQFARKHFHNGYSFIFSVIIQVSIWVRAIIAGVLNLFAAKPTIKVSNDEKYFLIGDSASVEKLTPILKSREAIISEKQSEASELIFCEGEKFSFKEIIEFIQTNSKKQDYFFHANNSSSIISSAQKNIAGEFISLHS